MDSRRFYSFTLPLLIISSLFCLHARADDIGSVFFLDSPSHQYIRPRPSESTPETDLMSLPEVGAAVSVLLGFAPSASLSADSSSKLNEVLVPNPFDRPRAVFLLEVKVAEGSQHVVGSANDFFSNALRSRVIYDKNEVDIQVPDEDELSVVSLNEHLSFNSNTEFNDKELNDFAFLLGGSYVANALKSLNGNLTIPLTNGVQLKLHMSKKADRESITSLLSLMRNIQREIELHQDLSGSVHKPAELMTGSFNGIKLFVALGIGSVAFLLAHEQGSRVKIATSAITNAAKAIKITDGKLCELHPNRIHALHEQYGTDVARQGMELFATLISKIFDSLRTAHKGKIVGVVFFSESPSSESEPILDVKITSRPSPRLLEEEKVGSSVVIIKEVLLVRRTIAWVTGIILLIATLLGTYFLLNMPITRDTLLYSNVKLD